MASFTDMKRNREKMFATLNDTMAKASAGGRQTDERIWYPAVDKAGNGYAVIRFLPPQGDETIPYVQEFTHGFKAKGGWYIEKSLTTLNEADPVSEYNQAQWQIAEGIGGAQEKEIKNQCRNRKRTLSYWSNVYIVKDPANPDNEGKVKLFRYGKKIYDMLQDVMNPQFPDEKPVNPFDLFEGANFTMKIRTEKSEANSKGFRNYDKSSFESPAPLFAKDAEMEAVWKAEYPLQELISADKFKTYKDLKARFDRVMGINSATEQVGESAEPQEQRTRTSKPAETLPWQDDEASAAADAAAGDDDDLDYYKKLAEQA